MWWLILHHFYRASIRKAWVHTLSTRGGEKNDAKLTAVCMRPPFRLRGQHGDRDLIRHTCRAVNDADFLGRVAATRCIVEYMPYFRETGGLKAIYITNGLQLCLDEKAGW